jgi:hypothetical protein
MLELAAAAGEIDLKYLDESGFCAWSEPGYTYYQRSEQKKLEQTLRRGRRLSIIGFFQPLISFVYGKRDWGSRAKILYSDDGERSRRVGYSWTNQGHSTR